MADKGDFLSQAVLRAVLMGEPIGLPRKNKPLWLSLHEADPGPVAGQQESEIDYPGYGRAAVKRGAWAVEGSRAELAAQVDFGLCTGGERVYAAFAVLGTQERGAGEVLYRLHAKAPILIEPGVRPRVPAGSLTIVES